MSDNNGNTTIFTFDQSVANNIQWIKRMAEEHDCSQGLVANAAIMTMLMMDHTHFKEALLTQGMALQRLEVFLCPSVSSAVAPKE